MGSGTDRTDAIAPGGATTDAARERDRPAVSVAAGPDPRPADGAAPTKRRPGPRAGSRDARVKEGNVGATLRGVYQQTVNEEVPDDLMQLLGKLS